MTKPSEHEAAHSLSEAADQARKRREWQMSNRPKLPERTGFASMWVGLALAFCLGVSVCATALGVAMMVFTK